MQIILYLIMGIIIGMFFPIQASISARLSSYSKTPLTASLIAFFFRNSDTTHYKFNSRSCGNYYWD